MRELTSTMFHWWAGGFGVLDIDIIPDARS
jgi:hypothetical protein